MTLNFFQAHWDTIGGDIRAAVKSFFNGGKILRSCDFLKYSRVSTVVKNMIQLRPISLFIVFYKIISEVLAARLRTVVNDVIGPHQSAFLHGRLVSDNIPIIQVPKV